MGRRGKDAMDRDGRKAPARICPRERALYDARERAALPGLAAFAALAVLAARLLVGV